MDIPSVKRQVAQARSEGIAVRGLVFINPGRQCPYSLHTHKCSLLRPQDHQ